MPKRSTSRTQKQLVAENEDLRAQLDEAEETLRAIRSGEVDALVVSTAQGERIFTLKGADRSYRILIEDMNEGALTMTMDGLILYANRRFAEMLKTSLEKVIGSAFHTWIVPDSQRILQTLLRRDDTQTRLTLLASNGTLVPAYLSTNVMQIEEMQGLFCLVATDLTEQKRTEEIVASEKLARELLASSNQSRLVLLSVVEDQKRAEELLRRAEENFRRSLDDSPLGVRIVTKEGETIYANRAILDIYDYNNIEELKTTPVVKRYTPESFAEHQIRREKRKRGDDGPSEYDISIVRKDGGARHLQVFRKEILWDGERQFQVLYNDITERKRTEEALQQSEEKHRVLIETTDTGYLILDAQGRVIDANKEYIRIAGYGALEEILGRGVIEWTAPYDLERNAAEVKRCVEQGYVRNLEIDYVNRSGQIIPIEINATVLGSGDSARIVSLCRDITERRKAEEALRAERDKLETVTKNVGAGLAIISKDYRTVWANDVIRDIFGETEGKLCYVTYNHQQTICPWCGVRRVFEAGEDNVVTEAESYDKDENRIWSQIIATPIRDESGEITAALEVVIPITDRKKAEEEIKRSHQQLRALAKRRQQISEEAGIMIAREIHDELGGGLTGLKMDLAWLLHKVSDAEAGKERIFLTNKIRTSSELIDQMIQVVRRIATDLRPFVLDDLGLVAALEWQLQEFTKRTEIPFEFATDFDYVTLEQDTATAVFRIFQETLTNVARHSGATKVTVLLREEDGSISLEIRDNGRGITEGEILSTKSLGILGMKERALVFGGELRISGEPGGGTAVILKIPQEQGETP